MAVRDDYVQLMRRFLEEGINVEEFQNSYFSLFKHEARDMDEAEFGVLDALFGDVDAYTDDRDLLQESPGRFLDEEALRSRVRGAMEALSGLAKG